MSYQSPIEVVQTQLQSKVEEAIFKAVMKADIYVDKDELLKALAYDRHQYQKGYNDRDREIVRCKDCRFCEEGEYMECMKRVGWFPVKPDWFCADGRRKEGGEAE